MREEPYVLDFTSRRGTGFYWLNNNCVRLPALPDERKKVVKRNKDCYRDCSCWELMSIDWYPVFSALTGNTCFFKICVKKIILIKITFWILKQINGWGLVLTCFFSLWRIETWIPFLSTPSCYLYCTDETRKWWIEYIADSTHLLKSYDFQCTVFAHIEDSVLKK